MRRSARRGANGCNGRRAEAHRGWQCTCDRDCRSNCPGRRRRKAHDRRRRGTNRRACREVDVFAGTDESHYLTLKPQGVLASYAPVGVDVLPQPDHTYHVVRSASSC